MISAWAQRLVREVGRVRIVDVGARAIDGQDPVYEPLVASGAADLVGIEADDAACGRLRARYPGGTFHAATAGDGSERTLHLCRMRSKSSIFPPNPACAELFQTFGHGMEVDETRTVRTVPIDSIDGVAGADWLTMDVQGAEKIVLEGGSRTAAGLGALQLEMEFVEQYAGQPLFGDVDCEVRRHGLVFHRFTGFGTRAWRPMMVGGDPTAGIHQWLWADAVYVAAPARWPELSAAKLSRTAVVMHEIYGSWDLAYALLAHLDAREGSNKAAAYLDTLQGTPAAA